jgi:DNA-binding NarL/FixJ family response regulator
VAGAVVWDGLGALMSANPWSNRKDANGLTGQQAAVLRLLCQDKTSKQIGAQLWLVERTVKHHRSNMLKMLGLKTSAGLAVWAVEHGYHLEENKAAA